MIFSARAKNIIGAAAVAAGTLGLYLPFKLFSGRNVLLGIDYFQIHRCRLDYARNCILESFRLPGWYTREFAGTPFWSNIHNFPWIPNHVALLLFDPSIAYSVGVALAALLAAGAMYLYLRALKLAIVPSAVSAWTYAASGFFAARVLAGHLPILEVYGALPLLLWALEMFFERSPRSSSLLMTTAVFAICLAGHPQIPAYTIIVALLYAWGRMKRVDAVRATTAMVQGITLSSFIWIPALLLIGRSTRILPLGAAANDVVFPYKRLGAYLFPWKDGWPSIVMRSPPHLFAGHPNDGYFWDTVGYVGWLPVMACVVCLYLGWKRKLPPGPWSFIGGCGLGALLLALPLGSSLFQWAPQTIFHSPARLIYVTNFSLIVFLGVFLNRLWNRPDPNRKFFPLIVIALAALHIVDVGHHARSFVRVIPADPVATPGIDGVLESQLGSARVAIESGLFINSNRKYDDVGFDDPVALALPYQHLIPTSPDGRLPNLEEFSGSRLSTAQLSALAVKFVITPSPLTNLPRQQTEKGINLYAVPHPMPRVAFVDALEHNNASGRDLTDFLKRPSSDDIRVSFDADRAGFVQFVETWDAGWNADVNGAHAPILKSNGFFMAVPVKAGPNAIRLSFRTPGAYFGFALSLLGLCWIIFYHRCLRR